MGSGAVSDGDASNNILMSNYIQVMSLEEYEKAFGVMMHDTGLIYGNMARQLYRSEKLLAKKYRLLRLSYDVFIYGLVLTILSFLIVYSVNIL